MRRRGRTRARHSARSPTGRLGPASSASDTEGRLATEDALQRRSAGPRRQRRRRGGRAGCGGSRQRKAGLAPRYRGVAPLRPRSGFQGHGPDAAWKPARPSAGGIALAGGARFRLRGVPLATSHGEPRVGPSVHVQTDRRPACIGPRPGAVRPRGPLAAAGPLGRDAPGGRQPPLRAVAARRHRVRPAGAGGIERELDAREARETAAGIPGDGRGSSAAAPRRPLRCAKEA